MKEKIKMATKAEQNKKTSDVPSRKVNIDPIWRRFLDKQLSGKLEVLVELEDDYVPDYLTITGSFTVGFMRAQLPASALGQLETDSRVLSVELREFSAA